MGIAESGQCTCLAWYEWWALNRMAHSQEFSPVSSLGSQVAQMYGWWRR